MVEEYLVMALTVFFAIWLDFQPVTNTVNGAKETFVQNAAYEAVQEAKIKGYFTPSDLTSIQTYVQNKLGTPVTVTGTETPEPRGQMIECEISSTTVANFVDLVGGNNTDPVIGYATAESEALNP